MVFFYGFLHNKCFHLIKSSSQVDGHTTIKFEDHLNCKVMFAAIVAGALPWSDANDPQGLMRR